MLWSPAYSMANSFIWEWISKTGRNSFLVLVMKVQYYPDTLFSVILCLKCSLLLRTLCSVCKIQKHYKGPLCKIQKLQSQLCKIQKHYILPVHCWIATFLTCCLKLWLLTAELPSCQITEWKMSWQTISGDGFAPINVLDQIPMGSAQAQRFDKDRLFTFIIWTNSKGWKLR